MAREHPTAGSYDYGHFVSRMQWAPSVDLVVLMNASRSLVFWFGAVGATVEPISVMAVPTPVGGPGPTAAHTVGGLVDQVTRWLSDEVEAGRANVLTQAEIRGVPLRYVQLFRSRTVLNMAVRAAPDLRVSPAASRRHTKADERLIGLLQDAIQYEEARLLGASPAEAIAQRRGISRSAADQRIANARAAGLLTRAESLRATGALTAKARRLRAANWIAATWPERAEGGTNG